jgi:hypothetical protein
MNEYDLIAALTRASSSPPLSRRIDLSQARYDGQRVLRRRRAFLATVSTVAVLVIIDAGYSVVPRVEGGSAPLSETRSTQTSQPMGDDPVPAIPDYGLGNSINVGTSFNARQDALVTGVRF